jgi:hypothetical protein
MEDSRPMMFDGDTPEGGDGCVIELREARAMLKEVAAGLDEDRRWPINGEARGTLRCCSLRMGLWSTVLLGRTRTSALRCWRRGTHQRRWVPLCDALPSKVARDTDRSKVGMERRNGTFL